MNKYDKIEDRTRFLLWHPESDSLFVDYGSDAEEALKLGEVEDVTGAEHWESRFKEQEVAKCR